MASDGLFRMKSIKGPNGILVAMRHNKRELQTERGARDNIDPLKSHLNYSLFGLKTAEEINRYSKIQMINAGIDKPRKNAVYAVEIVFSLPISWHSQDTRSFFEDCREWLVKAFPAELISFEVHLDESAPHAHALILPIIDGRLQGSALKGGIANINRLQADFLNAVARHYGLRMGSRKKLSFNDQENLAKKVLNGLANDPVMKSSVWAILRDAIASNPLPYAQLLNIQPSLNRGNGKSFVAIMTSKGKGKPYIGNERVN